MSWKHKMWKYLLSNELYVVIWAALFFYVLVPTTAPATDLTISSARIGVHPDATRFVLESSGPIPYRIFALSEPHRIVIDLPEVYWRVDLNKTDVIAQSTGVITNFRYGLFRPGNSRVVIDIKVPVKVRRHFVLPPKDGGPYRFVVDLEESFPEDFDPKRTDVRSANWKEPSSDFAIPSILEPLSGAQTQQKTHVIVIDPGHGGVDPGAIGVTGAYEKHVNLATAIEVKRVLEESGRYKVVLTRERDVFLRLRDRFAIAHDVGASLFVSLHADSHSKRSVRGMSVYTLSNTASDKEAEALAAKENKADVIAGADLGDYPPEVSSILIDLAQSDNNEESWHFAEMLVSELDGHINILENPHRFAGFAVLKSPNVPSLLVELGYLSNRLDEKLLRTNSYMRRVAQVLLRSIDLYFERWRTHRQS